MLPNRIERTTNPNTPNKHARYEQALEKATTPGIARIARSCNAARASMPDDVLPPKRRGNSRSLGTPQEPSEADAIACFFNPTKADQEVTRKAAQAKSDRPDWWAAMVRAIFGAKTPKAQALIMPQACALQARTIGVKKAGKTWLSEDGQFSL